MKPNYYLLAAGAAALFLLCRSKRNTPENIEGMTDSEVSIENIRRGVANGWYTAELTRVDGAAAVRLSGKTNDGSTYTDVYPISESDYNTLMGDGYKVV